MGRASNLSRIVDLSVVCLLLLVTNTYASKCTVGCHGTHPSKSYEEGKTYLYDLEGSSSTIVTDAQGEATLKLKATVELLIKPDCVRQIKLKNVQVNEAAVSAKDLERHALQFNYHDGHIDTEVCAESGDSQASLNIKRAVISLFQSAVMQESGSTTYHETDVFGGCPTDFSFHKDGDSTIVQKHRNLGQCSHRETIREGLIASTFNVGAGIKTSPILGSHQRIEQRFKRGILNKAVSTETYKYRPFSYGEAGAKTTIEMALTLKGDKTGDTPATVTESKSLLFDAPHPTVDSSSVGAIDAAVAAVKAEKVDYVKPEAAQKFSELIKVLRMSNKQDILAVYNKIKGTEDKKILLDALFRTGTGEAAEVATELIKTKEMGKVQELMYCASLAMIRHVHLPSLVSIASILDEPDLPRICYLGVGHAIGKHCAEHPCENVAEVKEAVHKIREKIGNGKTKTREQENQIIAAMKALGNAKFLDDATLQKLANIAADKNVRNRVRVAAIDALPARCSTKWKGPMLKVLADREEDSEVRIMSYLSLVDCVDANVANQIKEILDKETVNQVGSFVTTHLRNLRATADPNKQNAKQFLQNIRSSNKFPEDFRKFSFNNELSYSADALGVSSALESNVIFSQNSFVPRLTSLNLTAELFGHSFNFLELEARVENLDRMIERYFGPKGAFRDYDNVKKAREEGVEKTKDLYKYAREKFDETVRGKRQVKSADLERFAKGVRLRGTEVDEDLDLDLSLHAFGTELVYFTYHGDSHKVSPKTLIDNFFAGMKKTADKAKNFHHDFEGHVQFLDAELVYPTGMGLPMSLGIVSSGVARLKTQAKFDINAIFKDPENAAMQLALEPSASVNVLGTLTLKAFDVESGMKIVSTLHTSTGSDLSVKVLQGRGVDVTLGVPKRKQEIISMSSEVLLSSGPKGDKYIAPKFGKGKEYSDCFDQFSSILGMTICGKLTFPYEGIDSIQKKPIFPLSGPAKFAVTLENNDVSTYHFRTHYDNKDSKKRSLEILLETPNSRTNRKVSLVLEGATEPHKYIKASFDSPIKKASAELALKNNPQERSLTMTVDHDKNQYFARIGLLANGNKYKPVLEYKVPEHIEKLAGSKIGGGPDGQQYNLEGTVDLIDNEEGKKFVFENVNLVKSGRKLIGLDGHLQTSTDLVKTDLKLRYAEDTLSVEFKGKRDAPQSYSVFFATSSTRDPNFGLNLSWNYKKQGPELTHNLMIVHGADRASETNRFTLDQNAVIQTETKDFLVSGSTKMKYPALKFLVNVEGKVTPSSIKGDVEMNFEKFKAGSELSGKLTKNGDYEGEFEAKVLDNSLELKAKRTVLAPNKYKFENSLTLSPGGKYSVNGVVTYDVKPNDANVQLDAEIDLNGKNIKVDTGLESNEQKLHSRALVNVNKVKYVEFVLKVARGANPNGNLNVNLKDYLTVSGQFGFQNGKGNADLNIDVPKINRKIKGTADLTVSGSQRVANLELLYDADKDPTKRIKLSTVSDITKTSLDTKNVFEILSQKFEVNAKGKIQGTFMEGSQSADIDVLLPNGHRVVYTIKRNFGKKGDQYEGMIESEMTYHLEGKISKFIYNANGKVFDPKENTYDFNWDIKCINFEGKDLRGVINMKHLPNGENKIATLKFDLTGSELKKPIDLEASLDYNKGEGKYKIKTSHGDDLKIEGHGRMVRGNHKDKPYQYEGFIDARTSHEKLRNLKFEISESLHLPSEKGAHFEWKQTKKLVYNDDKTIESVIFVSQDGTLEDGSKSEGKGSLTMNILKNPTILIESSYKHDPTDQMKKAYAEFGLGYGEKKINLALDGTYAPDLSKVNLGVKATTPIEKMRNIDFQLEHKREKDGHLRKTDVAGTIDGAKYTMNSEIQVDPTEPIIHLTSTCPSGKTELLFKYKKLGDREYTGEWKLETPKGFVVADATINLEDSDNFVINLNLDSDKMKQRKIHAELANKPTPKAGRRIVITVTSDGKNIVTGSTNYKKHNEDGKIIVEGNGNLKIGDNTRSSSFKYTRQQLTREVDGEVGVAVVLNANFGPSAVVGEVKLSNKEVHVFNSYCEQSKDCAHFKLQAAIDTDRKSYMKHQITVELDLKKFNVPVEFGLKTSTEYKDLAFDHSTSLYLHSAKDKSQYVYQFYIHPKESGSILTLPSREMALVITFDLPKTRQTGAYKLDISHYLDRKNKPNDKTSLTASGDINLEKGSASMSGELKFTYPNQPKEMMMKGRLHYGGEHLLDGNLDVDVFSKKSQKISIVAKLTKAQIPKGYNLTGVVEVNSRGQQLKLETKDHLAISATEFGFGSLFSYTDRQQKPKTVGILFSINPQEAHLLLTGPNKELLKSDAKMKFSKDLQTLEGEVAILGDKPHVMNFEAKDWQSFVYVHYVKGAPNNKLAATGRIVLGQLAEAHAEVYKDGNKKNLFNVLIHLDEDKFLKPDFSYNKDNIVGVMEHYRTRAIELAKQLKEVSGEIGEEMMAEIKDFIEHLKKSQPVLKPLVDYYQTERNKIKEELHADATVKEIHATLNALFGGAITAITETLGQVAESLEELHKQFNVITGKIGETMKSLYPQLKESYNKIFNVFLQMLDAAANLGLTYLKAILNLINEHQKELKELATVGSELIQDVAKVIFKGYGQVKKELNEFATLLIQQIKALPIFDMIKEKYQELLHFEIPEAVLSPLEEISNAIKAVLPTEELREFFGVTYEYLMKHVRRQKVDDANEIKKIYTHAVAAVQSILALLQSHANYDHVFNVFGTQVPIDLSLLTKLPGITSLKLSLVNLLRNHESPTPLDVYYAYRPTLRLTDIVPPFSKIGTVIEGGHVFTFDGRHFTMEGTCDYVLAQDMKDGNFSVVANFEKGALKGITVTDPKDSMTIRAEGKLLVNGKPAEYPTSTKNLHAFLIKPIANIKSDYGVHVICNHKAPLICSVRVSGFYLGKLRGLFGDGNNEPFDDYTLPSGKITESETEFGNAYKVKGDCSAATAVDHHSVSRAEICTEYFTASSPMSGCFNYVKPNNYRDACDHAVKANTPQGACLIAAAYFAACYEARIYTTLPSACANCQAGANKISIGDSFSVKIPKKEADMVFVVEQDIGNEKIFQEFITPLMSELRNELKQQGITDVHIGIIGFGQHMKWPQHYTTNGNTNIEGEIKNMIFDEKDKIVSFKEAKEGNFSKRLEYLKQRFDVEFGTFKLTDAYEEAIRYPFRPGAAKAVIGVMSTPCEKSPLPISLQQVRLLIGRKIYRDLGLSYYHISFPSDILVSGKPQKNIIGWDYDTAYTLGDKKQPLEGSKELKQTMTVATKDVCADFALSSGGAVFSSNNFLEAKPNQKKQFVEVAARRITEGLTGLELQKDCTCTQHHGLYGKPSCKIVARHEKGGTKA